MRIETYVTFTDFVAEMRLNNRRNGESIFAKDKFSYGGLRALFEFLEAYEDDIEEEIEFNAFEIASLWTEYANLEQYNDHNESEFRTLEALREHTTVLEKVDDVGCDNHDYSRDGFVVLNKPLSY